MSDKGVILVGEPMALFMATVAGSLDGVTNYDVDIAGAEINVAIGMTRLGHRASYITKLGYDPFAKLIEKRLEDSSIDTSYIKYSPERNTGFMLKNLVFEGDPEIAYFRKNSAASQLNEDDLKDIDFSNYDNLHVTGIMPAVSKSARQAIYSLVTRAKEEGLFISFDPNLRPQLWEDEETMIENINNLASQADIFLPGINEAKLLSKKDTLDEIVDFYLGLGIESMVIKLGADGAYLANKKERKLIEGYRVDRVVDTVGAGDGFAVGMVSGLMEGLKMEDCVLRANAIGAIQVQHRSDNQGLPSREDLNLFMEENK